MRVECGIRVAHRTDRSVRPVRVGSDPTPSGARSAPADGGSETGREPLHRPATRRNRRITSTPTRDARARLPPERGEGPPAAYRSRCRRTSIALSSIAAPENTTDTARARVSASAKGTASGAGVPGPPARAAAPTASTKLVPSTV